MAAFCLCVCVILAPKKSNAPREWFGIAMCFDIDASHTQSHGKCLAACALQLNTTSNSINFRRKVNTVANICFRLPNVSVSVLSRFAFFPFCFFEVDTRVHWLSNFSVTDRNVATTTAAAKCFKSPVDVLICPLPAVRLESRKRVTRCAQHLPDEVTLNSYVFTMCDDTLAIKPFSMLRLGNAHIRSTHLLVQCSQEILESKIM